MIKFSLFAIAFFLVSYCAFSQVGINTTSPKATLDVSSPATSGSVVDGVIAPRVLGDDLKTNDGLYGSDQKGTIIYVTAAANPTTPKTVNVTGEGYYWFDGSIWQKIDKTDDEWINDKVNSMVKLGKQSDGLTDRAAYADFVVKDNGNTGIGTVSPSTKLHIVSGGTSVNPIEGFKLVDGNQASGRILRTDNDGLGSWQDLIVFNTPPVTGTFLWAANTAIGNDGWNSVAKLDVPPGTHMIYGKIHFRGLSGLVISSPGQYIRFFIGKDMLDNVQGKPASGVPYQPILGSTNFSPIVNNSSELINRDFEMNVQFIYTNETVATETLYMNVQSDNTNLMRSAFILGASGVSDFKGVYLAENYFFYVSAN